MEHARDAEAVLHDLRLRPTARMALGIIGLMSWVAGGLAVFVSDNGPGTAGLIAGGAVAGVVAMIGRWPSRVAVSGHEISWDHVRETVESQIDAVKDAGPASAALTELAVLRDRLAELQRTGNVPRHPAQDYDDAVAAALRRAAPAAKLYRSADRSRTVADFEVVTADRHIHVETKWRRDATVEFVEDTVEQLVAGLPGGSSLLVVTNSVDVDAARERLAMALNDGRRVDIVTWTDERDDTILKRALSAVFEPA